MLLYVEKISKICTSGGQLRKQIIEKASFYLFVIGIIVSQAF